MTQHIDKVLAHADELLSSKQGKFGSRAESIERYKRFLKTEEHRVYLMHKAGGGGLEIAGLRSQLLDVVLRHLFDEAMEDHAEAGKKSKKNPKSFPVALVATGGYGRGLLNPGSDVDLLFMHEGSRVPKKTAAFIEQILYMLWDVGFEVGHATRSLKETFRQANLDHQTRSSLLEARFIAGHRELYDQFDKKLTKECIEGHEEDYLRDRLADLKSRHAKYANTVYLQEPHVKNGLGGLRDYHCIIWLSRVKRGITDLKDLVSEKLLTMRAYRELQRAYDFVHRVRNELHYQPGSKTDILTLRLQGVIATNFKYPQPKMLGRIEEFMRDYYMHTRSICYHTDTIVERFQIELDDRQRKGGLTSFLAKRPKEVERFDGFYSKGGRIFPESTKIFEEDPDRFMRLFQHLQKRELRTSPQIRMLIKRNWKNINRAFRYSKVNRAMFENILSQKGAVAVTLRQMHRVGFLGRYLPEFGSLTCLVQHEFFHRYTADEHTLACIDQLDALVENEDPSVRFYRKLFFDIDDPYPLYLALIMHDTGRAANVRHHEDASTELASKVCSRLHVHGERRKLLLFLVDNHLTLYQTATKKNPEDPETISEFVNIVKNQSNLNTLLLFTYVDSKGTSDESWTSWKESMLLRLYALATQYLEDSEGFRENLKHQEADLSTALSKKLSSSYAEEIAAHLKNMPTRYLRIRRVQDMVRDIRTFRKFFERMARSKEESLAPATRWIDRPNQGSSEFIACGWDRHLFLARIAGALAAHGLNILRADIYTRSDDLVLDSFIVCTTDLGPVSSEETKKKVVDLLSRACTDPEFDLTGEINKALERRKTRDRRNYQKEKDVRAEFPQRVFISNDHGAQFTYIEIQAIDRLGLLYAVFRAIGELGHEIIHARISTQKGAAIDSFYVADSRGRMITERHVLAELQCCLEEAVGIEEIEHQELP